MADGGGALRGRPARPKGYRLASICGGEAEWDGKVI